MPKQLVPKAVVAFLLSASAYGTAHLAQDYLQAVFGTPDAQWQFAFVLAPIPILLGMVGLVIARFSRPRLSRVLVLASWVVTLVPLGLLGLVWIHAY
jgi:hypothetical protein